jgi:hypothetical protein
MSQTNKGSWLGGERGTGGLGERSYGDDVAVAPWEGVAAAEDRAHRVHEPADVIAHAALPLLLSFSDVFFWRGGLIRARVIYTGFWGVRMTNWDAV